MYKMLYNLTLTILRILTMLRMSSQGSALRTRAMEFCLSADTNCEEKRAGGMIE